MNQNFHVYQALNLSDNKQYKPGDYIVIAGGQVFRKGKSLEKYVK